MPQFMRMKIIAHFDSSWDKEFGRAGIYQVKAHMQTYYCECSLGTKINLNVSIF